MSHDQKPGRMRVVGNAAPLAQRRRGDPAAPQATDAPTDTAAGAAAAGTLAAPVAAPAASRPTRLLATLFLFGCAAGGVAMPLLWPR